MQAQAQQAQGDHCTDRWPQAAAAGGPLLN